MANTFTEAEIEYLRSQRLGRLATLGPGNRPHLTPVGVFYDPQTETIVVAGHADMDMDKSQKFRNARDRSDVAFIVDDLADIDPWRPRGIEIRGRAEAVDEGGGELGARLTGTMPFHPAFIRVHPRRILAWGIDGGPFELSARDVPPARNLPPARNAG